MALAKRLEQGRRAGRQLPRRSSATGCSTPTARGPVPARRRGDRSRRSTPRSTISAWRWARSPSATWRAWMSAGASARSIGTSSRRACATPLVADRLCEMGRYGQKTGAGWYRYDGGRPDARSPTPKSSDSSRSSRARPGSRGGRSTRRRSSSGRSTPSSTKGRASWRKASPCGPCDIDIIYINGYGFPAYRGGPMWYADTVGLEKVCGRIREFEQPARRTLDPGAPAGATGRGREDVRRMGRGQIRPGLRPGSGRPSEN